MSAAIRSARCRSSSGAASRSRSPSTTTIAPSLDRTSLETTGGPGNQPSSDRGTIIWQKVASGCLQRARSAKRTTSRNRRLGASLFWRAADTGKVRGGQDRGRLVRAQRGVPYCAEGAHVASGSKVPGQHVARVFSQGDRSAPREARAAVAALTGIDERARQDLMIVVSELVANAVRHAPHVPTGEIRLTVAREAEALRVEVRDPGTDSTPFPTRLPGVASVCRSSSASPATGALSAAAGRWSGARSG